MWGGAVAAIASVEAAPIGLHCETAVGNGCALAGAPSGGDDRLWFGLVLGLSVLNLRRHRADPDSPHARPTLGDNGPRCGRSPCSRGSSCASCYASLPSCV